MLVASDDDILVWVADTAVHIECCSGRYSGRCGRYISSVIASGITGGTYRVLFGGKYMTAAESLMVIDLLNKRF
eukprot:scaffold143034_cov20-Prasinocladus_malaysianus.AAC.2